MLKTTNAPAAPKTRYGQAYERLRRHEENCNRCHRGNTCNTGEHLLRLADSAVREDRRHGDAS